MAPEKLTAIVIKTADVGESNKRITLLAKEKGKVTVFAKGAKNSKSKLLGPCQLFAYGQYIVFEGSSFYSLTQAELKDSFFEIGRDLNRLSYAVYAADLVEKTLPEGIEADNILRLLYVTLKYMAQKGTDARLAAVIFEIKYLQLSGLLWNDGICTCCGNEEEAMKIFSIKNGGFVCENCHEKSVDGVRLRDGSAAAVNHILNSDIKHIFLFKVDEQVRDEMFRVFEYFVREHLCDKLKTLDFAKECEEFGNMDGEQNEL